MLAFIDSPIQLVVVAVVVLLVFGPQKLPEMLHQLGRAIREFKRTTSDLSSSLNLDDRYDQHYNPPRYDSYGNQTDSSTTHTVPEEDVRQLPTAPAENAEPVHGDFAASALADVSGDYGVAPSVAPGNSDHVYGVQPATAAAPASDVAIRPAAGNIARHDG
jgi:TatA/E family protein of Tat protein translocase